MFNKISFQIDLGEEERKILVDNLQRIFSRSDPSNPAATVEAVEQVIGEINVVDPTEREGSPWRNRPLRHFMPDQQRLKSDTVEEVPRTTARRQEAPAKDWKRKPDFERPTTPPPVAPWKKGGLGRK